ncbi:GerAB/ArcD/ProY family transporter [Natronospora cellulosivora (SeqCode)]
MTAMKEHGKLTERQFAGIIANTLIGAGSLIIPRTATNIAGTGGWISLLIAGFAVIISLFIMIRLGLRFPEETFMEYSCRITNKWIGKTLGIIYCIYWLLAAALIIRVFSSMIKTTVLFNTPLEIIIISMLIVVVYFIRHDIQVIGRINELYFIFIIIPIILGVFLAVREINVIRLMPFTGGQGIGPIFAGSIDTFFSLLGFEVIILLLPSLVTQKLAYNYGTKGIVSPLAVYMVFVIIAVGLFGVEELQNLTWPTLEVIKATPFPGLLLERLEAVFIAFWVVAIFTSAGNILYSSILGFTQIFELHEHRTLSFPFLPLVFFIAIYPENIYKVFDFTDLISRLGGFLILVVPITLYLIAIIRDIKGDARR